MRKEQKNIYPIFSEKLSAYIKEHNMRHTQERFVILEKICEMQHFTIEELRSVLCELMISRATVYNAVMLFESMGLIHKLHKTYGVRATHYQIAQATHSTIHIICERCGRVSQVRDVSTAKILIEKPWSNFEVEYISLYLFGHCKRCKK